MPQNNGKRSEATGLVTERLRDAIINREYEPGARITETEVAETLEVSRTPVREALLRLAAEGYVELVRNKGAVVSQWSRDDLEEIIDLRILLESHGGRLAATHIELAELEHLRKLARTMDDELPDSEPHDVARCADLNTEFHGTIMRASGNARVTSLVANLTRLPLILRTISVQDKTQLRRSFDQHWEMIRALEHGDGEWVASLFRSHISAGRQAMREAMDRGDLAGLIIERR